MSLDVYNETILAYAKNPPNKLKLENPSITHYEENRTCGDAMEVFLQISPGGVIEDF